VILYELLAGTVPFPQLNKGETSRNAVMLSHMEKPVPDLLSLRRTHLPESWSEEVKTKEMNVPVWLINVIKKCLEKAPEKRYANGLILQEAILRNSLENELPRVAEPVTAAAPVMVPVSSDLSADVVRVSKPIFYVMILALVALSLFAGYSVYLTDVNKRQLASYADSLNMVTTDTVVSAPQDTPETDTAAVIKPIIPDSSVLNANTEVDSLQKEFERQTGTDAAKQAPPKAPATVKEKTPEVAITSEGKKYQIPKGVIYFYAGPDPASNKEGVLPLWTNAKIESIDEQNGFIYITVTTTDGSVTKGWIRKTDLKEIS
jgi:serine/threonine-protein kinase